MALYLNLYHEVQNQKLKRQRDPFKIAIAAALMVAVGFIGYYLWRVEVVKRARSAAAQIQSDWGKLEPKFKEAEAQKQEYEQNIALADILTHRIENRFYWAPLIQQIVEVVPQEVQVTALDGSLSTDGTKKVSLSISGLAADPQPRAVAERLRIAIQNKLSSQYRQATATFVSLEDGAEPVVVQGHSVPTATFVIGVTFSSPDIAEADKPLTPIIKR